MKLMRKKTVIVKLQGGLGNQMFQYAVAKGVGFERVV
jgi:molybdopterin/thiamine biosynthesis adenylyltransferase